MLRARARARGAIAVIAGLAALTVLAACAGSAAPSITPPAPSGAAAAACRALDPRLPGTVDGATSSAVTPSSPYTAGWADIVLTCGGPTPAIAADAQLVTVDGVDWYPQSLPQGGTRFTTVGRVANVSVLVPSNHSPAANALVDLSPPIGRTVPVRPR